MKEFQVNKFITLKLENGKTEILVQNQKFRQCKFLLINIPIGNIEAYDEIESIDDAADKLDKSLEREENLQDIIPPYRT